MVNAEKTQKHASRSGRHAPSPFQDWQAIREARTDQKSDISVSHELLDLSECMLQS